MISEEFVCKSEDTQPLVSIVIPVFNSEETLAQTVATVFSQTYTNWEVIFVDDCSRDGSYELCQRFVNEDKRISLYQMKENAGPGAARKLGCTKAKGDFIAFLDADDLWVAEKLDKQIHFMLTHKIDFLCSDYEQIDGQGKPLNRKISCREKATYRDVLLFNPIGCSTVVIAANLLREVELTEIRKNNDFSLWLRLLKVTQYIYGLQETLAFYRVWPKSISYNKVKKIKYHWLVFREYEHFSILASAFLVGWWCAIKVLKIK